MVGAASTSYSGQMRMGMQIVLYLYPTIMYSVVNTVSVQYW